MENKAAYRHSGYQGGLRTINYGEVLRGKKPERVIQMAVKGMLPKTKLARDNYSKLHVYAGDKHPHVAQSPKAL
jgi:large subunit ribosomal protein L13